MKGATCEIVRPDRGPDGLTPDQERALEMIVEGMPNTAVGIALGVGENQIRRWRMLPDFHRAYHARLKRMVLASRARCARELDRDIDALIQIRDAGERDSDRIAATRTLLELAGAIGRATTEPDPDGGLAVVEVDPATMVASLRAMIEAAEDQVKRR